MQKLLNFLIRNYSFFLFLILQLIAFIFILQSTSYTRTTFFNATNGISGGVLERYHGIQEFANLKYTNQILAEENARLRTTAKESYFSLYNVQDTIVDTILQQRYFYIPAKVISSTYTNVNNNITLNRGFKHGIKKGMGVINDQGVIGKVKDVSEHFSIVYPLIHQKGNITGRLKKTGHFGQITWNAKNFNIVQLNKIQRHAQFSIGDTVISDVRSKIFPNNINIGTIRDFELDPETQFYKLNVELIPNFTNVEYVYVIKDLFKDELQELENANNSND